ERMASTFQLPSVLARVPSLNLPDFSRPTNVSTPRIRRTNSYDVNVSIAMLKHGFVESLEAFYVMFDSEARIGSFSIDYSIHASNLPDPSEGRLHVIIKGPSTDSLDLPSAPNTGVGEPREPGWSARCWGTGLRDRRSRRGREAIPKYHLR